MHVPSRPRALPPHRVTPRALLVAEHTDLCAPPVPLSFIREVITMLIADETRPALLSTKYPERLASVLSRRARPLPRHVWVGVSVSTRQQVQSRVPALLSMPAVQRRFLRLEPLLGRVTLRRIPTAEGGHLDAYTGLSTDYGARALPGLDWVWVSGPDGHRAPPMHPSWVYTLLQEARNARVPLLHRSWGRWRPSLPDDPAGLRSVRVSPSGVLDLSPAPPHTHLPSMTEAPSSPADAPSFLTTPAPLARYL